MQGLGSLDSTLDSAKKYVAKFEDAQTVLLKGTSDEVHETWPWKVHRVGLNLDEIQDEYKRSATRLSNRV